MRSRSPSSSQPKADARSLRGFLSGVDRSTVLWGLAVGVGFALFMTAPVSDVYFSHFRSWEISDRPSTTGWAQLWRGVAGPAVIVTFLSSIVSGAIAFIHVRDDDSGPGAWGLAIGRVVVSFLLGIIVEWTTTGVQDGSARDIDLVPVHSIVLLMLAIASPWIFAAIDLIVIRRR